MNHKSPKTSLINYKTFVITIKGYWYLHLQEINILSPFLIFYGICNFSTLVDAVSKISDIIQFSVLQLLSWYRSALYIVGMTKDLYPETSDASSEPGRHNTVPCFTFPEKYFGIVYISHRHTHEHTYTHT